jgi:hypothetical protein
MIISNTIRLYIEDKIMSVPDAPIPEEEKVKTLEKVLQDKQVEAEQVCKKALTDYAVSLGLSKEDAESVVSVRAGFSCCKYPLKEKINKIKEDRLNAKRRAIRDILVHLELEGKKAYMDTMIQKAIASLK